MALFGSMSGGFPVYFTPPQAAQQQAQSTAMGKGSTDKDVKEQYPISTPKALQNQSNEFVDILKSMEQQESMTKQAMYKVYKDNHFNTSRMQRNGDYQKLFAYSLALKQGQIEVSNIQQQIEANKKDWDEKVGATRGNGTLSDFAQNEDGDFFVYDVERGMMSSTPVSVQGLTGYDTNGKRYNEVTLPSGAKTSKYIPLTYAEYYKYISKDTSLWTYDQNKRQIVNQPVIYTGEKLYDDKGNPLFMQKLMGEVQKIDAYNMNSSSENILSEKDMTAYGIDPAMYKLTDIMLKSTKENRTNKEKWDALYSHLTGIDYETGTQVGFPALNETAQYFSAQEMKSAKQEFLKAKAMGRGNAFRMVLNEDGNGYHQESYELNFDQFLAGKVADAFAPNPRIDRSTYQNSLIKGPTYKDSGNGEGDINQLTAAVSLIGNGTTKPTDPYNTRAVPLNEWTGQPEKNGNIPFLMKSVPVLSYSTPIAGTLEGIYGIRPYKVDAKGNPQPADTKTLGAMLSDGSPILSYGSDVLVPLSTSSDALKNALVLDFHNETVSAPNVKMVNGRPQIDYVSKPKGGSPKTFDSKTWKYDPNRPMEHMINQKGEMYVVANIAINDTEFNKLYYEYEKADENGRRDPGITGKFYGQYTGYQPDGNKVNKELMKRYYGITQATDEEMKEYSKGYPTWFDKKYIMPILIKMNSQLLADPGTKASKANSYLLGAEKNSSLEAAKAKSLSYTKPGALTDPMLYADKDAPRQVPSNDSAVVNGETYVNMPNAVAPVPVPDSVLHPRPYQSDAMDNLGKTLFKELK
jgi:hypothetical protein